MSKEQLLSQGITDSLASYVSIKNRVKLLKGKNNSKGLNREFIIQSIVSR